MDRLGLRSWFRTLVTAALPLGAGCSVDGLPITENGDLVCVPLQDRKSTRLNSSHSS